MSMHLAQSANWGTLSTLNWILEMLVFDEGNTGIPREKPPGATTRTTNKLNPQMTPSPGNRTRDTLVGGECSHHCAIPVPAFSGEP